MKKILCAVLLALMLASLLVPVYALPDGAYCVDVTLSGGSGKASVTSPAPLDIKDGEAYAVLTWSSANYDYMIVNGVRYENEAQAGRYSTFTIPVTAWNVPMAVIADTTAMGHPVEIAYELTFLVDSIADRSELPQDAALRVLYMAAAIIVVGGVLNAYVKRRRGM